VSSNAAVSLSLKFVLKPSSQEAMLLIVFCTVWLHRAGVNRLA
jgi:hypothetical protein